MLGVLGVGVGGVEGVVIGCYFMLNRSSRVYLST